MTVIRLIRALPRVVWLARAHRRIDRKRLSPELQARIALCELNGAPRFEDWAAQR